MLSGDSLTDIVGKGLGDPAPVVVGQELRVGDRVRACAPRPRVPGRRYGVRLTVGSQGRGTDGSGGHAVPTACRTVRVRSGHLCGVPSSSRAEPGGGCRSASVRL